LFDGNDYNIKVKNHCLRGREITENEPGSNGKEKKAEKSLPQGQGNKGKE